jgi:hypothetical protein
MVSSHKWFISLWMTFDNGTYKDVLSDWSFLSRFLWTWTRGLLNKESGMFVVSPFGVFQKDYFKDFLILSEESYKAPFVQKRSCS